jgi:hypothetical protein
LAGGMIIGCAFVIELTELGSARGWSRWASRCSRFAPSPDTKAGCI